MSKQKVQKERHRSCEKVNLSRARDLFEYGKLAAALAKSRGQSIDTWSVYCGLIGDNNTDAWRSGWDAEFNK